MTPSRVLLTSVLFFLLWRNRASASEQQLNIEKPRGIESRVHPILGCLKRPDVGNCLQKSVFGFLEDWLLNGEEANGLDRAEEDLASMHPYLARVVDGLTDAITIWNSGGTEVEEDGEEEDEGREAKSSKNLDIPQEATRGHHKEKKKQKKQRLTKIATHIILLILYFVKSQLFYMFDHVVRTGIFAGFALILKVFIILKFIELKRYLWLIKEDKKDFYHHEVSHHDHHYDHHHHDHDDSWFGSWAKSWPFSGRSNQDYSHQLAYSASVPQTKSSYTPQYQAPQNPVPQYEPQKPQIVYSSPASSLYQSNPSPQTKIAITK